MVLHNYNGMPTAADGKVKYICEDGMRIKGDFLTTTKEATCSSSLAWDMPADMECGRDGSRSSQSEAVPVKVPHVFV